MVFSTDRAAPHPRLHRLATSNKLYQYIPNSAEMCSLFKSIKASEIATMINYSALVSPLGEPIFGLLSCLLSFSMRSLECYPGYCLSIFILPAAFLTSPLLIICIPDVLPPSLPSFPLMFSLFISSSKYSLNLLNTTQFSPHFHPHPLAF